jgi:hypothetical protein
VRTNMDHLLNKNSGTILVVEDDVESKEVLCATLELEGYVVTRHTRLQFSFRWRPGSFPRSFYPSPGVS